MSPLFNMLSRLLVAVLPRSKCLFSFMAAVTICSDFGAQENKVSHCFLCFPIHLPWNEGNRCYDLSFLNVEFQASFFTYLFHFHQEALQFLCAICHRVVSSAYLKLLIFLVAILIPACDSFSPTLLMMYSAYKLNKQGDNIQPWRTLFLDLEPVCCSMSSSNCGFLTCIQISLEAGQVFPSFSEFSTVYCDPHSQRVWRSQ